MESRSNTISHRSILVAVVVIPTIIILDQITKSMIWNRYGPGGDAIEAEYLGGLLTLHFVRNTGAAFGLFQGQTGILTVAIFVAIGFLVAFFIKNARESALIALALSLLVGGAVGNLIDRVQHGYVIDWIKLPNWPSFNVADSSITVGVILLFVTIIVQDMQEGARQVREREASGPAAPLTSINED